MNNEKRIKAEMLLEGIGEIDDALLAEAAAYRSKKSPRSRLLILAATLAVVFTLIVGNALVAQFAQNKENSNAASPEQDADKTPYTLDNVFSALKNVENFDYIENADSLPYFDGAAHVVWQYEGEKGYYLSDALTGPQLTGLTYDLGIGSSIGDESPELECMVWVLLGDGRVISPYLKASAGNIGTEVFDYEAEIMPDDSVIAQIQDILS